MKFAGSVLQSKVSSVLVIVALAPVAAACGDEDDGSGLEAGCPDFSRIVAVDFQRTGDACEWTLQVRAMPASFTLNQASLAPNVLEYRWGVELDANEDGQTDLSVSVSHFKSGGERVVRDLLGNVSVAVWEHDGALSNTVGSPDVTVDGNVFKFRAEDGDADGLAAIVRRSQTTWVTGYRNGALICEDERR